MIPVRYKGALSPNPRYPMNPLPFLQTRSVFLATAVWIISLTVLLSTPYLTGSPTLGNDLTRNTVRLTLVYYAGAASLMVLLRQGDWAAGSGRCRLARCGWTLAWAAYLVHLAMAFHHYHHWSHAEAVAHTRSVSG